MVSATLRTKPESCWGNKVRALRLVDGKLSVDDIPVPVADGEAIVRVVTAGICNTDLEILRGYAGFSGTLGHEFVGIVESSPVSTQIGTRVVGEINAGCGRCPDCLKGDSRHCPERNVLGIIGRDGAFANYLKLPARNLLAVPENVTDRQAVFTEPLAAACEIIDQVGISPQDRVAVIGDGKLGQLIARVLKTTGCHLSLMGKHEGKLQLAQKAGIETLLNADARPPYDIVVEASGSPTGLERALELVRPRGTVVLKSTVSDKVFINTTRIVVDEIQVLGSRCGRFEAALDLLARNAIDVEPLISAEYSLGAGVNAMKFAAQPGVMKVLLKIDQA